MDLSLSDEQKQLQESAERFVRDKYTFENRRKIAATEKGWLPENWSKFAELGWLAIPFSEEHGGIGRRDRIDDRPGAVRYGPRGRTVHADGRSGRRRDRRGRIGGAEEVHPGPDVEEGKTQLALALRSARPDTILPTCRSRRRRMATASRSRAKGVVYNAASADEIVVVARTDGDAATRTGITLFVVDKGKGVTGRDYPTADGCVPASFTFENVRSVQTPSWAGRWRLRHCRGGDRLRHSGDLRRGGRRHEGAQRPDPELHQDARAVRRPIGKFQVLQHRMVDMFTAQGSEVHGDDGGDAGRRRGRA